MWLVMHEDLRDTRRIRLLYDHLAATCAAIWERRHPGPAGRQKVPLNPMVKGVDRWRAMAYIPAPFAGDRGYDRGGVKPAAPLG